MTRFWASLKSTGRAGLALNLALVWAALALSIVLLTTTGGSTGFDDGAPRGAPWTPPGAVIAGVWTVLYTTPGGRARPDLVLSGLVVLCLWHDEPLAWLVGQPGDSHAGRSRSRQPAAPLQAGRVDGRARGSLDLSGNRNDTRRCRSLITGSLI